jgi:uncharacterized protein
VSGRLIEDPDGVREAARRLRRVAVLGIKTEAQSDQPAYYVPAYLSGAGIEVVPVPVYYPEATEILGQPVIRDLTQAGSVDAVVVFRRPADVPPHVDDLLRLRPPLVWMQSGIRNEQAAARLTAAGIDVVQDRCVMVEHRRALAGGNPR